MAEFNRHIGELPWGWWLRAGPGGFQDDAGRTWLSVRDAFWQGELGFPPVHFVPEQHELMLRVMTSIQEGFGNESEHDIFAGDMMFWRFYQCWLASIGMIGVSQSPWGGVPKGPLNALGRSVLMMLQATREPEFERLPMSGVVAAVTAAKGLDAEARERTLLTFEREVGFRRHLFAREGVGTRYLVTLTGLISLLAIDGLTLDDAMALIEPERPRPRQPRLAGRSFGHPARNHLLRYYMAGLPPRRLAEPPVHQHTFHRADGDYLTMKVVAHSLELEARIAPVWLETRFGELRVQFDEALPETIATACVGRVIEEIVDVEDAVASYFGQTLIVTAGSVPYCITWSQPTVPCDQ